MVGKSFENGDLVWAKMKGFPFWPAEILPPPADSSKKFSHYVHFFTSATNNCAWIADELIKCHSDAMYKTLPKKISSDLQLAIDHIKNLAATKQPQNVENMDQSESEDEDEIPILISTPPVKSTVTKSPCPRKDKITKSSSSNPKKKPRVKASTPKTLRVKFAKKKHVGPKKENSQILSNCKHHIPTTLASPPVKPDLQRVKPTSMKIGVLGMGPMGQYIALNLLSSGHHVTVWNRTPEKCDGMVTAGAIRAETPADAVLACDVIFGCLSDTNAVKSVMFSVFGVLKGIEEKGEEADFGYIEMTSIDDEFAQEISECVTVSGGRYLEAPMIGTRQEAETGELMIISSGNPDLFDNCASCFHAVSKYAIYVSAHVGEATQLRLIYMSLCGMIHAATAEALALCERVDVNTQTFLEIAHRKGVLSPTLVNKAEQMLEKKYLPTSVPLKHQQRDMNLALGLVERLYGNSPIARFTNAIYVHTKRLGYGEHDSSAVYHGVKF